MIKSWIICQTCKQKRLRVAIKKTMRVFYYSPSMKSWKDGNNCHHCKPHKVKKLEPKKEILEDFTPVALYYDKKSCQSCKGRLELSKYKICLTCQPTLPADEDSGYFINFQFKEVLGFKTSELPLLEGEGHTK